jgi:hypothetical protein
MLRHDRLAVLKPQKIGGMEDWKDGKGAPTGAFSTAMAG